MRTGGKQLTAATAPAPAASAAVPAVVPAAFARRSIAAADYARQSLAERHRERRGELYHPKLVTRVLRDHGGGPVRHRVGRGVKKEKDQLTVFQDGVPEADPVPLEGRAPHGALHQGGPGRRLAEQGQAHAGTKETETTLCKANRMWD